MPEQGHRRQLNLRRKNYDSQFRIFVLKNAWMAMNSDSRRQASVSLSVTSSILPAGVATPNFTLRVTPGQTLSLSRLQGRPVILTFYPAGWSPVCGDELALFNGVLPEFRKYTAELLGISVDGVWCHRAFAHERKLHFPLLADFEPKGEVAKPGRQRLRADLWRVTNMSRGLLIRPMPKSNWTIAAAPASLVLVAWGTWL
jgi:peroxiredoxin